MGAKGGVDMKISMDMIVTSKEGDMLSTESKIKSINMNMLQGGMAMSYDSSMKEEDLDEMGKMMKQQFDPMMKSTITSKVNIKGEILETKKNHLILLWTKLQRKQKGLFTLMRKFRLELLGQMLQANKT